MLLTRNNRNGVDVFPFENLFNEFFNDFNGVHVNANPKAEIVENDNDYQISLALPGFKKEDINIEINKNVLEISGERKFEKKEGHQYHKVETYYGKVSRNFTLPENANQENLKAAFKNGILEITLPKQEVKKEVKKIEIR